MAFVPVPNVAKATIVQVCHDQNVLNRIYVQNAAGWSGEELNTLNNIIITWWNDHLAANLSAEMSLNRVESRDLSIEEGAQRVTNAPALSAGEGIGGAAPNNVAFCVSIETGLAGRASQGRVYVGGLNKTECALSELIAARRDALIAAFQQLRDALLAADYQWVVVSLYKGFETVDGKRRPKPRDVPKVTMVADVAADSRLDSMRSRLKGRGL